MRLAEDKRTQRFYRSQHIAFAGANEKYEEARKLLDVNKVVAADEIKDFHLDAVNIHDETILWTSGINVLLHDAEAAMERGNYAAGVINYERALAVVRKEARPRVVQGEAPPFHPAEKPLKHRLAVAKVYLELLNERPVDLTFDKTASGWRSYDGALRGVDDCTLEQGVGRATTIALFDGQLGNRFQLEGSFDVSNLRGSWGRDLTEPTRFTAAILFRYRVSFDGDRFNAVSVLPDTNAVYVSWRFSDMFTTIDVPMERQGRFMVRVWDSKVSVFINDEQVFAGVAPWGSNNDPGLSFGLGGRCWGWTGHLVWRDLRLRYLADEPDELKAIVIEERGAEMMELPYLLPPDDERGLGPGLM